MSFAARVGRRLHPSSLAAPARRLAHFWIVWSALLFVHEGGHAIIARHEGLRVAQMTVGLGPVLLRTHAGDTDLVLRLVPLSGMTNVGAPRALPGTAAHDDQRGWHVWREQLATLAGGVASTLMLAVLIAGLVAVRERGTGKRWVWGRFVIADAVVISVFNFLPIPPLDGGRALLGAFDAWRGAPLAGDALFWVQVGGFALAIVPMMVWTRWTARIDSAAMRWCPPPALA